jgi:Holliday junction resolvasome RuvABC DNA-binding subunit
MDAALDAMRPLGYSEKFVREMVKELLKEEVNYPPSLPLSLSSFVKKHGHFWVLVVFDIDKVG